MPRNRPAHIKELDYNPDYHPRSSEKPLVNPDSSGAYNYQYYNEWSSRFYLTQQKDTLSTGMPAELIHPHRNNNGNEFLVNNGIFIFSVILLFVFAGIRIFYAKAIWGLGKAVFNNQWAIKAYEEKNSLLERVYLFLDVIFLFNASLSVYLVTQYYFAPAPMPVFQTLAASVAFVGIVYFSRVITIWFIALMTKEVKLAGEFLMVTNVFYKAAGILLFIPVFLFNYISEPALPWLSVFTLAILFIAYISTIIRGLYFAMKSKFYIYYYFLYLCAVEIMPLLLTTKMFLLTNGI